MPDPIPFHTPAQRRTQQAFSAEPLHDRPEPPDEPPLPWWPKLIVAVPLYGTAGWFLGWFTALLVGLFAEYTLAMPDAAHWLPPHLFQPFTIVGLLIGAAVGVLAARVAP